MQYKSLKDMAEITMGQSPDSSSYNEDENGIPFYQGNADFGEIHPTARVWCDEPKKIAKAGDILISVRAPIGALNYATEECCIGRGLAAITIENESERNYVFHLLRAQNKALNSKGTGSTFKAIGKSVLEDVQVPVISLEQQELSVKIMDNVEGVIRQRKQELQLLDNLIKARFVELFDNGNYPKIKLGDACKKITDGTHKTPNYLDEGITFISAKNIVDGELDFSDVKHISEEEYQEIQKRCQTEINDILLSKSGSLGSPVIVRTEEKLGLFESLAVLKYERERFLPEFLCEQLKTDMVQRQFTTGTKGVAIKHLHLGVIAETEIIEPPMEEQKAFAGFVKQVDKSKFV